MLAARCMHSSSREHGCPKASKLTSVACAGLELDVLDALEWRLGPFFLVESS